MTEQERKTLQRLVDEDLEHYRTHPRGYDEKWGCCIYLGRNSGRRCAIGRRLPRALAAKLGGNSAFSIMTTPENGIEQKTSEILQSLGLTPTSAKMLQAVHDTWMHNGEEIEGVDLPDWDQWSGSRTASP